MPLNRITDTNRANYSRVLHTNSFLIPKLYKKKYAILSAAVEQVCHFIEIIASLPGLIRDATMDTFVKRTTGNN